MASSSHGKNSDAPQHADNGTHLQYGIAAVAGEIGGGQQGDDVQRELQQHMPHEERENLVSLRVFLVLRHQRRLLLAVPAVVILVELLLPYMFFLPVLLRYIHHCPSQ